MKHFFSISAVKSTIGQKIYKKLFQLKGLDYNYRSLPVKDLSKIMLPLLSKKSLGGFSVSMPFKTEIVKYLHVKDNLVEEFNSCNTVLYKNKELHGYNTDYYGVLYTLSQIKDSYSVSILGNGSMAKMYKSILKDRAIIYSRSTDNWKERHKNTDVIINCTPFGTSINFSPLEHIPSCISIIDLSIKRKNQLEQQCLDCNVKYIPGIEFYKRHFVKQFEIYTGCPLSVEELERLEII